MSSKISLELSEAEAKGLWRFMCSRDDELDYTLSALRKRLEADLWDRLSIEEMATTASENCRG